MKYKLLPRRVTLLMYNDDDLVNYASSCQININGTRGTIDTINGKYFFKFMDQHIVEVLRDKLGLTEVCGAVRDIMLRRIKRIPGIRVEVDKNPTYADDIPLNWIKVTFE